MYCCVCVSKKKKRRNKSHIITYIVQNHPRAAVFSTALVHKSQAAIQMNPSVSSAHRCLRIKKKKKSKQLLAYWVASIRWWIEKSGVHPCFLHLSPCVNQPLCHSAQTRGREELCQVICFVPK